MGSSVFFARTAFLYCVLTYNALIDACGRVRNMELGCDLANRMKQERIRPDVYTLNTLIAVCGRCGDVERAFKVLSEMMEEGVRPDEVTYNTLIDTLGKKGCLDRAWRLLSDMHEIGLKPTRVTYNCFACACAKARDADMADMTHHMQADAVQPDKLSLNVTLSAIVDACVRGGRLTDGVDVFILAPR